MKKIIKFLGLTLLSSMLLSACSFFSHLPGGNSNTPGESNEDQITDFSFILDNKLTWEEEDYGEFYSLKLNSDEHYQLRTNVDDKIGKDYRFEYSYKDDVSFIVQNDGIITALPVEKTSVGSFTAKLYKDNSSKAIASHYVIVTVYSEDSEYATATLNDTSLAYDQATKTYTLNTHPGEHYQIALNITTNTEIDKEYGLTNSRYEDFMSVDSDGYISIDDDITESKIGKVSIKIVSKKSNKVLYTMYIQVNIEPYTDTDMFTISKGSTRIKNGDTVSMYEFEYFTLTILYNNQPKYNVMSTESDCVEIDNATNKITALKAGDAVITATAFDYTITFTVKVRENSLVGIQDPDEGNGFVIVNDTLFLSGHIIAYYLSGFEEDVTKSSLLTYVITDDSLTYKNVKFSLTKGSVTETVTYKVRYFTAEDYSGETTAFDFNDYGSESLYGDIHYLSNSGNLKLLVIPVWFTNSENFFSTSQKQGLRSYIQDKILGEYNPYYSASLKRFYETESRGALTISATITEFYETNDASTTYPDIGVDTTKTHNLAESAANWYFTNNPTDSRSNYDLDNDGNIDGIILFYAAYYYGLKSETQRTTAYAWPNTSSSRHYNTACFCSIGSIFGFNKNTNTTTVKNATDLGSINVAAYKRGSHQVVHEVGHMFGAVDLYEYSSAEQTKYYPCGGFSMQDSDQGSHEPYHTNLIGWTKPDIYASDDYEVGDEVTINIDDFQSSGNNIVLTKTWNEYNSLFDEYLILELYSPTGLNEFDGSQPQYNFNGVGFRLWHVNSILEEFTRSSEDNPYLTPNVFENGQSDLKYSTIDRDCAHDILHLIRNDKEVGIDCDRRVSNSDLFVEGDEFSLPQFENQFANKDRLDNEDKLGWSFKVEKIYEKETGKYGAVVTLTRTDSTKEQFRTKAVMGDYYQPAPGSTYSYSGMIIQDSNITISYNFNDSELFVDPGLPDKAISTRGIQLYADTDGNGGCINIGTANISGYNIKITKIKFSVTPTNGVVKVFDGDDEVARSGTYVGPLNPDFGGDTHDSGYIYDLKDANATYVTIQNCFNGTIDHFSAFIISTLEIEYSMVKNS